MRAYKGKQTELILRHLEQDQDSLLMRPGPVIESYERLVREIAKLAYINKDVLLYYRGQNSDHTNRAERSSFYPTIYRGRITSSEVYERFEKLKGCSEQLKESFERFNKQGKYDLIKRKLVQWSILQHYEVCETPLLDFTQSLRVACSFAFQNCTHEYAYIYIFGLPYITNRISINSEHDIINIRLLSISPPAAVRPFFQEGYLAGTDGITTNYTNKTELDFNQTCIAKYRIINDENRFWGSDFGPIPDHLLYPENDDVKNICDEISLDSYSYQPFDSIGKFVFQWKEFERQLRDKVEEYSSSPTIRLLDKYIQLENPPDIIKDNFHRLRVLRNKIIHEPNSVSNDEIEFGLKVLNEVRQVL